MKKHRKRQQKLVRKVKEAKELKQAAHRELANAKRGHAITSEQISSIATKFYKCVRSHNRLIKKLRHINQSAGSKLARDQCHSNFWRFSKHLLQDKSSEEDEPTFCMEEAADFFTKAYNAEPRNFDQPAWMPSAPTPTVNFNCKNISIEEITQAITKSRIKSSPSPFDGVPYVVFKKCPALIPALQDLFNCCWSMSAVPSQWKLGAMRLFSKAAAMNDPSPPSHFRPIALTSCVGNYSQPFCLTDGLAS